MIRQQIYNFLSDNSGATAIEYAFIVSLIAASCISAMQLIGISLKEHYNYISTSLERNP